MIDPGTLVRTKLYAPGPRDRMVARPRLVARLSEAFQLGHRLTLICAPAGYGKSTLVCQWLTQWRDAERGLPPGTRAQPSPCRSGWLTLDESDNDIARFLAYVIGAFQHADPSIGQAIQPALNAVTPPSVTTVATALINELAKGASPHCPAVIVLDDYQHIRAAAVHQMAEFLVEHAPPVVHWVVITREDPPFALSRLRVRGQLTEVREPDLRFTLPETASFLNETMRLGLSDGEVAALSSRTEGWIAGLQLAGLSLRDRDPDDRSGFVAHFSGSHRYVIDYLVDEVLRGLPQELRRFLCQTAILDRLCPSLCAALTGRDDSREVLIHLDQAGLFVTSLDDRREWYRYHRLFAECLEEQLPDQERAGLHRMACQWLEAHNLTAEAAKHALAAGEGAVAAKLVNRMAPEYIAHGELEGLLGWLDALPHELVQDSLELTMYRAWTLFLTARLRAAADAVRPMRARLPAETDPTTRARLLILQSWLGNLEEDIAASAQLAREALTLIGSADPFLRVLALDLLGEAQVRLGAGPAGTRSFQEGIELAERLNQPFASIAMLYNLAINLNRQGRRTEALSLCCQAVARYSSPGESLAPVASQLYLPLALLHYEGNELAQAREYLRKGLESPRNVGLSNILLVDGPWLQVNLDLAEGDAKSALATARQACQAAREAGHERVGYIMAACQAQAQLRLGNLAASVRWAVDADLWDNCHSRPPDPARELVNLILVELLLATDRLGDARALLAGLETSALEGGRLGRLIRIHLLQSASELAASSESGALSYLEQALKLAATEGYVRAFLDEGAAVARLLPRLHHLLPDFVATLIAATAGPKRGMACAKSVSHRQGHDLLSEQEMRILRLLAAGLSNREIAAELVITVGTVKWHVHNIYGKLGARHRAQAVARARDIGLPV